MSFLQFTAFFVFIMIVGFFGHFAGLKKPTRKGVPFMTKITTMRVLEKLPDDGGAMAVVLIEYPAVAERKSRINAFYEHQAAAFLRDIKKRFLPAAIAEHDRALLKSAPFKPFEISATFHVAHNGDILSFYRDTRVTTGAARAHTRSGETWDARSGWLCDLKSLLPPGMNYREVLKSVVEIAKKQEKAGTHKYLDDFTKRARKNFSPSNFYITDEGIVIFFDELTVAPRAEGIPVFVLGRSYFSFEKEK